jgi:hypothetical protein
MGGKLEMDFTVNGCKAHAGAGRSIWARNGRGLNLALVILGPYGFHG